MADEIDAKITKLQAAASSAELNVKVCREAWEQAERELAESKDKYRSLPEEQQRTTTIDQTELPELIETAMRAKNVFVVAQGRYEANVRYLAELRSKKSASDS